MGKIYVQTLAVLLIAGNLFAEDSAIVLHNISISPAMTSAMPFVSTLISLSEDAKDQVALAKPDAKAYLDHGVMSDELAEILWQLRQMDEFSKASDADIALAIYTYAN